MSDLAAIAEDRIAIVGTTGSGKTYAAKGMAENLIKAGARVCIVDPLGVWWGLRAGADGGAVEGLPVIILGGAHADVPIGEGDGEKLGRALAGSAAQCVVDVSDLGTAAAQRRFMRAFLEALYDHNRDPLHLILDEADLWAPQRPGPEHAVLQGKVSEIVRRGRVRGFVPWLITQRPAVLDKDVLSQADVLIAMKLTSSQDRAAIGAWIEGQGDRGFQKELLAALPRLERGTGWIWAPSRAVLKQATFPPIATYDSSRTPARGERAQPLGPLAFVDAAAVAALLETAAPGEPRAAPTAGELDREYRRGWAEGHDAGYAFGRAYRVAGFLDSVGRAETAMAVALAKLYDDIRTAQADPALDVAPAPAANDLPIPSSPKRRTPATIGVTDQPSNLDEFYPGPARILRVLAAHHPARLSEAQWAKLARMTRSGGTWSDYRRTLRIFALVEQANRRWSMTPAGWMAIGAEPAAPLTPGELLAQWKVALGTGPARLLDALLAHPEGLTREQLAALVRMEVSGGTFNAHLRALITHELADSYRKDKRFRLAAMLRDAKGQSA